MSMVWYASNGVTVYAASRAPLNFAVMPEYPESAKNNHADHLDVFWDHW